MTPTSPLLMSTVSLGYVLSADRSKVLMLYHNADPGDSSYGKYNGLTGRLEAFESVAESMRRVVRAETGVEPGKLRFRGTVHWSGFGRKLDSLLGHVFVIEGLLGEPPTYNPRGQLHWVEVEALHRGELPMWAGDEQLLPLILDQDPRPFHGYMPYDHGVPRSWSYERTD